MDKYNTIGTKEIHDQVFADYDNFFKNLDV